jgi:chromosome segregation protein
VRFTRLRLSGFKSFVDPTELVIAEGLTGVVGPNGCGKSNLLEALRWVMGEQRPTAMRGDGMEDVIFSGSSSRPARAFAEVVLQLDNSERRAPAGFNETDTLEISRRITRDAGSAYRVNGREVRARDVQMLFADAATGAASPALVRQGQIAELIAARPKSRRRVLEDAAGIGGLYQRRHEAELRLAATEQNLARIEDVLDQLSQQFAQLTRQARQAARYREIGAELRRTEALLVYRRWSEADAARMAAEAALTAAARDAGGAEAAARAAAREREAAEAALPPRRDEAAIAGAVVQRLRVELAAQAEAERRAEAAREALAARIAQLHGDERRETALTADADATTARLDDEIAALEAAQDGHDARLAALAAEADAAAAGLDALDGELARCTEAAAREAARQQAAQRLLADRRAARDKGQRLAAEARAQAGTAEAEQVRALRRLAEADAALEAARQTAERAEAAAQAAETARGEAQAREATARAARSAAEGEAAALTAERAALARLVAREAAEGSLLLDRITVAPGYEAAIGAALGDDLRAPEAALGAATSGWAVLPELARQAALPAGAEPIARHVAVPAVLRRRIAAIGLVDRASGPALQTLLQPGQRLVSREGDMWRWDGLTALAADTPNAAALRLSQLNRIAALARDLAEAEATAEGTRRAHETLQARLAELSRADQTARELRRAADQRLAEAHRAQARAQADGTIAAGRMEDAGAAAVRLAAAEAAAATALAEAEQAVASLPPAGIAQAEVDRLRRAVDAARQTAFARRAALDAARRDGEARRQRLLQAGAERHGWQDRLSAARARIADIAARRAVAEAERRAADAAPAALAEQRQRLAAALADAGARATAADDALATAEGALRRAQTDEREADRAAGEARERRAAAEARAEAARAAALQAAAQVAEVAGDAPHGLLERLGADPDRLPSVAALETESLRLRRAREALGAVNLRAEEDGRAVQAEHETLSRERGDLEEAVRKLRAGIGALNREGRERLLTAFEQVNANFGTLFRHLFGGGEARLVLVESDDPLEAGLEILAQPPGKKLSTLTLLSGGEQTLTALALIFGVFLANPAPICVLDEVDAPLDDANVTRFCDLLDEMTRRAETRFLIITHHAVTMARMDRLFGVTMAEPGVSQLVSVDLRRAALMVA